MHFTRMCLGLLSARDIVTMCVCNVYFTFVLCNFTPANTLVGSQTSLFLGIFSSQSLHGCQINCTTTTTTKIEYTSALWWYPCNKCGTDFLPQFSVLYYFLFWKLFSGRIFTISQTILVLCNILGATLSWALSRVPWTCSKWSLALLI